ncbi:uncharacterized protein [Rutidosis leptorrhynchoides]|uniref:uncharacterized protein n=1 Tax=Rutidosis leptorrhynchoides TaxID=125765 RepID=UPI003A9A5AC3
MEESREVNNRPIVLCKRLGNLRTEVDAPPQDRVISEVILDECNRTVFGKLYSGGSINFQAFLITMKRAWKVDSVTFTHHELGILSFTFDSEMNKERVLAKRPWSFASNLLILKPWEPNKYTRCYKFTNCAFWVQVHGLLIEWCSKEVVSHIAQILGCVKEVKVEKKGVAFHKVGRARVVLDLDTPLSPGILYNLGEGKVWLDFKYERLPRFCYSCGKVGHFVTNCVEVPFDEAKYEDRNMNRFGHWLKAKAKETGPFW